MGESETRHGRDTSATRSAGARNTAELQRLGILPLDDRPPFDIIGDVHGCIVELKELLARLGYEPAGDGYVHPAGRRVVFVGDLVDRGPGVVPVLRIALAMRNGGNALLVMGNHDHKFLRWLNGHNVRIRHGLAQTIAELDALPERERATLRERVEAMLAATPGYLLLDNGRLVVTHGALHDEMIGRWDGAIQSLCLFGDVIGVLPDGKPHRRDWGAERDLDGLGGDEAPLIVYGHSVVPELRWVNRTLDLDTGCVYGGALSALRYPEGELISVPAKRVYAQRGGQS